MNYGYPPTTNDDRFARDLSVLIRKGNYVDANGRTPYVEVDGLYQGVRIRRITHLSPDQIEKLVAEADKIHAMYAGNFRHGREDGEDDGA